MHTQSELLAIVQSAMTRYTTGLDDGWGGVKPRSRDEFYALGYAAGYRAGSIERERVG